MRIGRRYPSPFDPDAISINWFHYKCIFSQQKRSRQSTQVLEKEDDMDGFDELLLADKHALRELMQDNVDLRFDAKLPNSVSKRESEGGSSHRKSVSSSQAPTRASSQGRRPSSGRKSIGSSPMADTPAKKTPDRSRRDVGRIIML